MVAMAAVRAIVIHSDLIVRVGLATRGMADRDRGVTTAATSAATASSATT
jgi:hypothetical protein